MWQSKKRHNIRLTPLYIDLTLLLINQFFLKVLSRFSKINSFDNLVRMDFYTAWATMGTFFSALFDGIWQFRSSYCCLTFILNLREFLFYVSHLSYTCFLFRWGFCFLCISQVSVPVVMCACMFPSSFFSHLSIRRNFQSNFV